jgi:hypothetical protein
MSKLNVMGTCGKLGLDTSNWNDNVATKWHLACLVCQDFAV